MSGSGAAPFLRGILAPLLDPSCEQLIRTKFPLSETAFVHMVALETDDRPEITAMTHFHSWLEFVK
jgi:hypothetical protein